MVSSFNTSSPSLFSQTSQIEKIFPETNEQVGENILGLLHEKRMEMRPDSTWVGVSLYDNLNKAIVSGLADCGGSLELIDRGQKVMEFWEQTKKIVSSIENYQDAVLRIKGLFVVFKDNIDLAAKTYKKLPPMEALDQNIKCGRSWLSTPESYAKIRKMFLENRINFTSLDLTNTEEVRKFRQSLDNKNKKIKYLYISNVANWLFDPKQKARISSLHTSNLTSWSPLSFNFFRNLKLLISADNPYILDSDALEDGFAQRFTPSLQLTKLSFFNKKRQILKNIVYFNWLQMQMRNSQVTFCKKKNNSSADVYFIIKNIQDSSELELKMSVEKIEHQFDMIKSLDLKAENASKFIGCFEDYSSNDDLSFEEYLEQIILTLEDYAACEAALKECEEKEKEAVSIK